ncbi:hypothetical protein GIB67_033758 [Kingdonia uniflora]|uniref:Uncharacterized protein n=1 Tax=Kingdonia uniflora TaxID=39325 RepID=A0A7J7P451_9MAGN|nr:hypothetical protein GIB67_033758 [Kingdonia uniflora]
MSSKNNSFSSSIYALNFISPSASSPTGFHLQNRLARVTMEKENNLQVSSSPMPIISRLDRLDHLMQYLEEKQNLSRRCNEASLGWTEDDVPDKQQCKPLSSALDEVHLKGTLMERVAMLENRFVQLNLEMEEGNISRSSSSTVAVPENTKHCLPQKKDGEVLNGSKKEGDNIIPEEDFQEVCTIKLQCSSKRRMRKGNLSIMRYRKWLGWFQMGC